VVVVDRAVVAVAVAIPANLGAVFAVVTERVLETAVVVVLVLENVAGVRLTVAIEDTLATVDNESVVIVGGVRVVVAVSVVVVIAGIAMVVKVVLVFVKLVAAVMGLEMVTCGTVVLVTDVVLGVIPVVLELVKVVVVRLVVEL
jgi:hypothetical protein